jgi:cell division protein ZapA
MADVELAIGGRSYSIACRDGGEAHLRTLAAHVDKKAQEAASAVGGMNEARQLLFAALLIADELTEAKTEVSPAPDSAPGDAIVNQTLHTLAVRIESIADALEAQAANA